MPWFQTARKLVFEIRPTVHIPVKASVFDNNQAFWKLPGKLWNGTKDQERPRKAKKGRERPEKGQKRALKTRTQKSYLAIKVVPTERVQAIHECMVLVF